MPIVVVATIKPKPQHSDEVLACLMESIPAVHAEQGCELYALHAADDALIFVEQWSSEAELVAHGDGEVIRGVQRVLEGKLAAPPEIVVAAPLIAGQARKGQLVHEASD